MTVLFADLKGSMELVADCNGAGGEMIDAAAVRGVKTVSAGTVVP